MTTQAGGAPQRHRLVVASAQAGERLDRYLAERLGSEIEGLSRSRIKALIEAGHLAIDAGNGLQPVREPSRKVKAGETVELFLPQAVPATPQPQAMALEVLYEDADLLVLDKPAGLVVHPAPGNPDMTLVNALLAHCGDSLSGIGGVKRPGIVHRLDKDTSGVMVVAKNDAAHQALSAAFARHDIERAYKALVWGAPRPPAGLIEGNIGRSPLNRKKMAVLARGGKAAATRYRTEQRFGPDATPLASLVECTLLTGRTHQVRVHLASRGHPLVGDPLYGRARKKTKGWESETALLNAFPRQALHAYRLGFRHPGSGELLRFQSDLPSDIKALVEALQGRI
ncbi:MAG: RluA family pseudouridine synthase [Reyranellaceae bacterium]